MYIRTSKGTEKFPYLSTVKILTCQTIKSQAVNRLNGLIHTLREHQMAKDYVELLEKRKEEFGENVAKFMHRNFFVDDGLASRPPPKKQSILSRQLKQC